VCCVWEDLVSPPLSSSLDKHEQDETPTPTPTPTPTWNPSNDTHYLLHIMERIG